VRVAVSSSTTRMVQASSVIPTLGGDRRRFAPQRL
jgi:hypothetical protein